MAITFVDTHGREWTFVEAVPAHVVNTVDRCGLGCGWTTTRRRPDGTLETLWALRALSCPHSVPFDQTFDAGEGTVGWLKRDDVNISDVAVVVGDGWYTIDGGFAASDVAASANAVGAPGGPYAAPGDNTPTNQRYDQIVTLANWTLRRVELAAIERELQQPQRSSRWQEARARLITEAHKLEALGIDPRFAEDYYRVSVVSCEEWRHTWNMSMSHMYRLGDARKWLDKTPAERTASIVNDSEDAEAAAELDAILGM